MEQIQDLEIYPVKNIYIIGNKNPFLRSEKFKSLLKKTILRTSLVFSALYLFNHPEHIIYTKSLINGNNDVKVNAISNILIHNQIDNVWVNEAIKKFPNENKSEAVSNYIKSLNITEDQKKILAINLKPMLDVALHSMESPYYFEMEKYRQENIKWLNSYWDLYQNNYQDLNLDQTQYYKDYASSFNNYNFYEVLSYKDIIDLNYISEAYPEEIEYYKKLNLNNQEKINILNNLLIETSLIGIQISSQYFDDNEYFANFIVGLEKSQQELVNSTKLNGPLLGLNNRVFYNYNPNGNSFARASGMGNVLLSSRIKDINHEWFHALGIVTAKSIVGISPYEELSLQNNLIKYDKYNLMSNFENLYSSLKVFERKDLLPAIINEINDKYNLYMDSFYENGKEKIEVGLLFKSVEYASFMSPNTLIIDNKSPWLSYKEVAQNYLENKLKDQNNHNLDHYQLTYLTRKNEELCFSFASYTQIHDDNKIFKYDVFGNPGIYTPTFYEAMGQSPKWDLFFENLNQWWEDDKKNRVTVYNTVFENNYKFKNGN